MDEKINRAEILFNNGNTQETLEILNEKLKNDKHNIDGLFLRAKVFYRQQKWGDVLNDLNLILDIDSNHLMAKNYKSMVMDIINFWNKDNFNP